MDANAIREKLFRCALAVLNDGCPLEEEHQFCRINEDYYDGVCTDCWSSYLFKVVNGEEKEKKP